MACIKLTAKCSNPSECCFQHVKETIEYTAKLLNEFKINYWADYNVLKGILDGSTYLSQNVFSYDIADKQLVQALGYRIFEDGYFLSSMYEKENEWHRLTASRFNFLGVDIIPWSIDRNSVRRKPIFTGNCNFNASYIENVQTMEFSGVPIRVPNHADRFIKLRYEG